MDCKRPLYLGIGFTGGSKVLRVGLKGRRAVTGVNGRVEGGTGGPNGPTGGPGANDGPGDCKLVLEGLIDRPNGSTGGWWVLRAVHGWVGLGSTFCFKADVS